MKKIKSSDSTRKNFWGFERRRAMLKVISVWQRLDEDALTMTHAFKCVDEIICRAVKSLVEIFRNALLS